MNFAKYISNYDKHLNNAENQKKLKLIINKINNLKRSNKKLIILGNGGSSASASHLMVDFTKQAKIKTINFNETSLITAFSNDYGYENYLEKALKFYSKKGDLIIFLSVSGNSKNLKNALKYCNKKKLFSISFTGHKINNFLNKNSSISLHVPSFAYNIVECIHLIYLTYIVDFIVGKEVYKVNK